MSSNHEQGNPGGGDAVIPHQPFAFQFTPEDDDPARLEMLVFQALGAASACWSNKEGAGESQSERAEEIGEALLAEIRKIYGAEDVVTVYGDEAGLWRWRRQSHGNHERIAASGEAFGSLAKAVYGAERANPGATLVVKPGV